MTSGRTVASKETKNRPFDQAKRMIGNSDYRALLRHLQEIASGDLRVHIHCFKESPQKAVFAAIFPNLFVEVIKTVKNQQPLQCAFQRRR